MVVLGSVGWRRRRFFLSKYREEFMVFRRNCLLGLCFLRFFYLVDYCLADFPRVRFADFPCFRGLLVVLFRGLFFGDCVGSWRAG